MTLGQKHFQEKFNVSKKSKKRSKFDASTMERKLILFVGKIINFVYES
jgi:hypothetical protein